MAWLAGTAWLPAAAPDPPADFATNIPTITKAAAATEPATILPTKIPAFESS